MATYADNALAAYQAKRGEWLTRGKERLRPLMTDSKGNVVLDPIGKTEEVHSDPETGLLILHTVDGSDLYFAVYPDDAARPVTMMEPADGGGFTGYGNTGVNAPVVTDLDDVGRVLAGDA